MTVDKMVKSRREPITPRRRASMAKSGAISKVTKVLSRPVSSSAGCVTPAANIRVVVRVRPPNEKEQDENFKTIIKVVDEQMLIFDPKEDEQPFFYHGVQQRSRDLLKKANKDITFVFDRVFGNASTNMEVFRSSTKSLINTLMEGCNCSVFAYGATGAGKTFTMIGSPDAPGITYLTMKDLFRRKDELSLEREFELMLTYIEVYNELVKDLLNPGAPLNLREDSKYGVLIPGVKGHKIDKPEELFSLLEQGNRRRTQHPTDSNAESSRSHAVFQVYIQMTLKGTREIRRAKLSMIDLAGSERGSATGFVGARFKEGANINKSLLALGNCINSLADGQRHVPYRDSKLTRLLKDSLGGNCHTIMIANVSPSTLSFDDTYNTLKYATRAKKIKSNIKRNIVNMDMHIDQYIKLVEDLQNENSSLKREVERLKQHDPLNSQNTRISAGESTTDKLNTATLAVPALELEINADEKEKTTKYWVDPEVVKRLDDLVLEKKANLEREFQLQSSELGMSLRRKLKEEVDTRLSAIFINTDDKEEARKKLNGIVERFKRKEEVTQHESRVIKENVIDELDKKIDLLVQENPEVREHAELAKLQIEAIEYKKKLELKQKEVEILIDDHDVKCSIIGKMATLSRSLFDGAGGTADAPESVIKQFTDLTLALQDIKNVKWDATVSDSGVSSSTSLYEAPGDSARSLKRKIETDSTVSLDSTFTMANNVNVAQQTSKAQTGKHGVNVQQLMAKGCKGPAPKRLANGVSPRNKENKPVFRRPPGRIETAKKSVLTKSYERPPFRR